MSVVHHSPSPLHGPENKRPTKGILKNPSASHRSPVLRATVTDPIDGAPTMERQISEKDIVLQNTLQNAGRRRSTSNGRPGSRRQSSTAGDSPDQASPRLKWDEANLYLTEQQKSSKMKITEPKTPYAKRYDPAEDEDELRTLNAEGLVVDELDGSIQDSMASPPRVKGKHHATREEDIPGLELGEPEESIPARHNHASPKQVIVIDDEGISSGHQHADDDGSETEEKHRKFAEMRKKHYEMKDVKELLGHPEDLLDDDEDEDGDVQLSDAPNGVPPVPAIPEKIVNGETSSS
ncbi:hypothetical protein BDZ91DRAFT_417101 [Kalaharituber pfeilii]|nr:hypothetical protein BDZ91DRAFT_417101 [Kalaharituber pfeilii]